MRWQLSISNPITNVLLADWSNRIKSCNIRTGAHGWETCEAELDLPFYEAFLYYQQLGPLKLRVVWGGYKVFEGRLEDPTQFANTQSGLKVQAFGAWVALNDTEYTALWSMTDISGFRPMVAADLANTAFPERYSFNTTNQLMISPQKNATLGTTTFAKFGVLCYQLPDQGSRSAIGVSFDYVFTTPAANWRAFFTTRDSAFTGLANPWAIASVGAGTQQGTINVTFASAQVVNFAIDFNAADVAFAGESGSLFLKITNFRLVSSTTNRISTTLGTNIAAGTRTVTPASMARIYVGQRLQIDQGSATVGESVLVTAITSTTFTAVFVFAHVIASTVNAHVVYPDEVIKDCVSVVNALNSTQLSSDTSAIQSQALDLDQLVIEDQTPTSILNTLLAKCDNQTPPNQWVAMCYDNQRLIVRPRGTGTAWYTDVATLEVVRTLTNLYNSVYAVYNDVSDKRKLRTAVSSDTASIAKFDITRRTSTSVDTTDATQAGKVRDALLQNQLDPIPRASITIDNVFDKLGNPYPLFFIRADDTLTLRNLPPILTATYDRIRTLVITHTDYDAIAKTITLELEIPMPDQSILLAQALKS